MMSKNKVKLKERKLTVNQHILRYTECKKNDEEKEKRFDG